MVQRTGGEMTDPSGRVFLSYSHEQEDVADLLEDALRGYGVPVWRDKSSMPSAPLESGIEHIIEDMDQIAGGILLVSKEVAGSDVILEVELPRFLDRWDADDTFFVVIVRCPDIGVGQAKSILRESSALHDFSSWYMEQLDEATHEAAADIADVVLKHRINRLDANLAEDQPIACSLDTYEAPAYNPRPAIAIDWSADFNRGPPSQAVWNQRLIPALSRVTTRLSQEAAGRALQFRGRAHLPASFALGRCLQETRGIQTSWMQADSSGNTQAWALDKALEDSKLTTELTKKTVSLTDLAVLISVSDEVHPQVGNTKSDLPEFNGILELTPQDGPGVRFTPEQACHAATVFQNELRGAVNELSNTSKIHLFLAGPVGLAFLFGQLSNALPPIQTYLFAGDEGTYQQAALISNQHLQ